MFHTIRLLIVIIGIHDLYFPIDRFKVIKISLVLNVIHGVCLTEIEVQKYSLLSYFITSTYGQLQK